jgi:hypothetical protein
LGELGEYCNKTPPHPLQEEWTTLTVIGFLVASLRMQKSQDEMVSIIVLFGVGQN